MKQRLLRNKVQTDTQKFPIELRNALSSVVGLRSSVPDDAFTAGILGTERDGYGAVIRNSGLVLTIGYLTAEAETIWITVRHRMIWHRLHAELAECLAHLVGDIRRRLCGVASAVG